MSSTAIILQQLTERAELNRTHGRLAFSMLLFQDLAFVPFLALASALARRRRSTSSFATSVLAVIGGMLASASCWRPGAGCCGRCFTRSRTAGCASCSRSTVLLVVLASAWVSNVAGLSLALGAFLSGMMLAETEYRHQIEAVIRPFRDILLGIFFISVGMLLDVQAAGRRALARVGHARRPRRDQGRRGRAGDAAVHDHAIQGAAHRHRHLDRRRVRRRAVHDRPAGRADSAPARRAAAGGASVLSMVLSPFILNNNKRIARFLLRERGPRAPPVEREDAATQRDRRARSRDAVRLRACRAERRARAGVAGLRVHRARSGSGAHPCGAPGRRSRDFRRLLGRGDAATAGLENASAVVISFSDPSTSVGILRSIRRLRPACAGAGSHAGRRAHQGAPGRRRDRRRARDFRGQPDAGVARADAVARAGHASGTTVGDIRNNRYAVLRNIVRRGDARPLDETHEYREELKSVVVPPGAWAVGRTLGDVRSRGVQVAFTGIRRHGILGREPPARRCCATETSS